MRERLSHKDIILKVLRADGGWVPGYKLRGVQTQWGFIGDDGKRRCREMARNGTIAHTIINGKIHYRAIKDIQPSNPNILEELRKIKEDAKPKPVETNQSTLF